MSSTEHDNLEERVHDIEEHGSLPAQLASKKVRLSQLGAYLLIVVIGTIGFYQLNQQASDNHNLAEQGQQAQVALCAQKDRLETQVQQTQFFLQHPFRFPAFSDPATIKLIRSQQVQDAGTIATLDKALSCGSSDSQ